MKIKTAELIGDLLDLVVTRIEVWSAPSIGELTDDEYYSSFWALAGPIIEREKISIKAQQPDWTAYIAICDGMTDRVLRGPTPIVAAMRCFVASKLGDEVEIPEALI